MYRIRPVIIALALAASSFAQTPAPKPAADLAERMARTLSRDLGVRTVVGDPVKVGSVTLIPILMVHVAFGGGGMVASAPTEASKKPVAAPDGFYMSGEARPLGFVAIGKKGTRFISLAAPKAAK